jgi:hypothetical protein
MRAADERVGVVDVGDAPPEPVPLDDGPGRFHLRKFRHVTSPVSASPMIAVVGLSP